MSKKKTPQSILKPLGYIEPYAVILKTPPDGQLIYKMMTLENLLRSIEKNYLHFNRVDCYRDFLGADPNDGKQLPKDQKSNAEKKFERDPNFTAENYYNKSRSRTYACSFSLENSHYIWENYANGSKKGRVCLEFDLSKLRTILNNTLQSENVSLEYNGIKIHQFFSINYGCIEYVEWDMHQINTDHLATPIRYTYLKSKENFSEEKEFRISLSTFGFGKFSLKDRSTIDFHPSLQIFFNFRRAFEDGTVRQIFYSPDCDVDYLYEEFQKFGIEIKDK